MRLIIQIIKYLVTLTVVILACVFIYFSSIETPYRPKTISSTPARYKIPSIIAHKARNAAYSPNTIEAIESLLAKGIVGIEIDIQQTKDGIPVLFHGLDLSEGTSGNGAIKYKTLSELKDIKPAIPTLEEVLVRFCGKSFMFLDIKSFDVFDQTLTGKVVELIKDVKCENSVIVDALNPAILWKVRALTDQIPVSLSIVENTTATNEESQEQLDSIPFFLRWRFVHNIMRAVFLPDFISVRYTIPEDQLQKLSRLGYPLVAWTVDDQKTAEELLRNGVQSIMTNDALGLSASISNINIDDASRLNMSEVKGIVFAKNEEEVRQALVRAEKENLKVSIAGQKHSMGGQTIAPGGLVIDMNGLNKIEYFESDKRFKAQSGARWKEVQTILDSYGRSVKIMQSDNIFSIGGSLSVNVHGWQPNHSPLGSTLYEFSYMDVKGRKNNCNRPFSKVCSAVLGGYGLLGVILDATFETTDNTWLKKESRVVPSEKIADTFKEFLSRSGLELLYGRLRVDETNLLAEAGVHAYFRADNHIPLEKINEEELVRLKRGIFRLSEYGDYGKQIRWIAERDVAGKLEPAMITRNQVMYSDFQFIFPTGFTRHDILHEYFIPINQAGKFIEELRLNTIRHKQNLLNVTIRHVLSDNDAQLSYSRKEVLSFVLLFSQDGGGEAESDMNNFTVSLIDEALKLDGTFYLPYRLHYTQEQLAKAYPMIFEFIRIKKSVDPKEIFHNKLWEKMSDF